MSVDLMEELLIEFSPLFQEPAGLPPPWSRCHYIQLLPRTAPVAVRPYHYVHAQKIELERQYADMLHQGVTRHNSLSFPAPVLLV
jgi:hypothetical protein